MSPLPYSCLPFGNLHQRAAAKCADFGSGKITPNTPSNFITSPPGMEDADTKAAPKTPLDMPPAQQTPTEQALGADADTLALRDEHAKLQAEHQKLQQQMDTAKQQAAIAKMQKAPAAAPKADSMGKYKSMSMQLMGMHLKDVTSNLKGLDHAAGSLPMQLKLGCAFRLIDGRVKVASTVDENDYIPKGPVAPPKPTSLAPKVLQNATSGTMPNIRGAGNIAETSDQAQRLSRLTGGSTLGGLARSTGAVLGGVGDYMTRPFAKMFGGVTDAQLDNNPTENQKDTAALFSTQTQGLNQAGAPTNYWELDKLDPVARAMPAGAETCRLWERRRCPCHPPPYTAGAAAGRQG